MKHTILSILFSCLFFTVFSQNNVTVQVPYNQVQVGQTIQYPVTINPSGSNVGSFHFILNYNPGLLQATSVQGASGWSVVSNPNTPGILNIAGYNLNGSTANFTGVTIHFKAIGSPGQYSSMNLEVKTIGSTDLEFLPFQSINGRITLLNGSCSQLLATNNVTEQINYNVARLASYNAGSASQFQWAFKQYGTPSWSYSTTTSILKTVTGLVPNTWYQWRVRKMCPGGIWSNWSTDEYFQTTSGYCQQVNYSSTSSLNYGSFVRVRTTEYAIAYDWRYKKWGAGESPNYTPLGQSTYGYKDISGLQSGVSYLWQVRKRCSNGHWGPWSHDKIINIPSLLVDTAESRSFLENSDSNENQFNLSKESISLYPNPVKDILTIEIEQLVNMDDPFPYSIINTSGEKLKSGILSNKSTQIDVSQFSNGIYLLSIENKKDKFTHTIVVQ